MKILVSHNFYRTPGGEDAVYRSEQQLLTGFGHEVVTYERNNSELEGWGGFYGFKNFLTPTTARRTYRELRALIKKFRPDMAHFHNIFFLITPAAYLACRDEHVPVVQSQHNFRLLCANALFYRDQRVCEDCLQKTMWEGVRHKCYRNSRVLTGLLASHINRHWNKGTWVDGVDMYITAAEFTRQKYIQRGIPAEKIAVKPHFLGQDPGKRSNRKNYALYVGRLSREKGVDVLIRAWRSMNGLPLKIVGAGHQNDHLKELAKDNPSVELLGHVSQQNCERYMQEAAVLIIPSVCYESFPRTLVEAYAHGLPVVASRLGSLAELIIDGETGLLFEAGNSGDLAGKVRYLMEHEQERLAMEGRARQEYERKYTPQENYDQLIAIYRKAMASARRS